MKKHIIFFIVMLLLAAPVYAAEKFTLTSPDIKAKEMIKNEQVLNGFGCSGENKSPALEWRNAPPGTKSYALMVYDPDAPTGSGWWHWVVYNIPSNTTSLPKGAGTSDGKMMPAGSIQTNTDFGTPGYGGPCPPPGKPHRYIFTIFALKVEKLELPPNPTAAMVGFFVNQNTIGNASLVGMYSREK